MLGYGCHCVTGRSCYQHIRGNVGNGDGGQRQQPVTAGDGDGWNGWQPAVTAGNAAASG
jgi:hypothetical protein